MKFKFKSLSRSAAYLALSNLNGRGNEADFLWFLQKLVPHRSLTLPFEPFRFLLRIFGDIRNRKTTPRLGENSITNISENSKLKQERLETQCISTHCSEFPPKKIKEKKIILCEQLYTVYVKCLRVIKYSFIYFSFIHNNGFGHQIFLTLILLPNCSCLTHDVNHERSKDDDPAPAAVRGRYHGQLVHIVFLTLLHLHKQNNHLLYVRTLQRRSPLWVLLQNVASRNVNVTKRNC